MMSHISESLSLRASIAYWRHMSIWPQIGGEEGEKANITCCGEDGRRGGNREVGKGVRSNCPRKKGRGVVYLLLCD